MCILRVPALLTGLPSLEAAGRKRYCNVRDEILLTVKAADLAGEWLPHIFIVENFKNFLNSGDLFEVHGG